MKRKISVNLYIGAFIITSIIFLAGFMLGSKYQERVYRSLGDEITTIEERIMDVTLLTLVEDSNYFCELYEEKLPELDMDTYQLGEKLEYMENKKGVYDEDTKKRYFELELRDYVLMSKAVDNCGLDTPMLIYFYNNRNCGDCYKEGYEITKVRKRIEKENGILRVYTFDGGIDSAVVRALRKDFGVENYPTIVLIKGNNTKKLEGFNSESEIYQELK